MTEKSDGEMQGLNEKKGLDKYLSRLDVGAISLGCMVGWGAFVMPGTTFLPIAAMTANAFKEDEQAAEEAGMQAHIAKPIAVQNLVETLERMLRKRQQD